MRRATPIKRNDGEPLTRVDLQYDVLKAIFDDDHAVFTDAHSPGKVPFRELYVNAILHSPKISQSHRDKLVSLPDFSIDFAMIALLANVGRVNTTMSFFTEMKTMARTYHPVPALQRTSGSLQDAPRLKGILKASLLEAELRSPPGTPADILSRASTGQLPPTSVTNLIFVLSSHSTSVGKAHFGGQIEFVDLFMPSLISSRSRALAFLWLCYHYLESSAIGTDSYDDDTPHSGNPFCDPERTGMCPTFVVLTSAEAERENVDTAEEKLLAEKLMAQRNQNINTQALQTGKDSRSKQPVPRGTAEIEDTFDSTFDRGRSITGSSYRSLHSRDKSTSYIPRKDFWSESFPIDRGEERSSRPSNYNVYKRSHSPSAHYIFPQAPYPSPRRGMEVPRTMLQHAWHVITTSDPLRESDDESVDEYDRYDYFQRLRVISQLRGKEPTPEPI